MLKKRYSISTIFLLAMLLSASVGSLSAQDVSEQYKKYFVKFADNRSIMEKAFNAAGLTNEDVGRSFALICGISKYPNMRGPEGNLEPAAEDVRIMKRYLLQKEFFDEIVVLENADVTLENLTYFLQSYFPERLKKFPKSRFLFAYSGHGMTENERGYLLESTADSLKDRAHAINTDMLRSLVKEVVLSGHQVLVLLNSCYGGAFLKRSYGSETLIPKYPGAHAITAGGSGELTWHDASLGKGSVFYEKIIAGLSGIADTHPDGIITANELATYLINEIRASSSQGQNPQMGDISLNGSRGEFFFLNKDTQVAEVKKGGDVRKTTSFGDDAKKLFEEGKRLYKEKNYNDAFAKLEQAAMSGNADAMNDLGMIYYFGNGVAQDYRKAITWIKKSAEAGDDWGMRNLGMMYYNGNGVTKDYKEAIKWYRKAAEAGNIDGIRMLCGSYRQDKNYTEAAIWCQKIAEMGDATGMSLIGNMYSHGDGVAKDYTEAIKWYRKAAEAGDAGGMFVLCTLYKYGSNDFWGGSDVYGNSVAKDYTEAVKWCRKAADAGDAGGMATLGATYQDNKDYAEAIRWYRKAAEAGGVIGMISLGEVYFNGNGVAKDYNEAIKWYRKAADAGSAEGMIMLGAINMDNKDYTNAATWYLKAAEAGNAFGMNKIGFLYENGTGVAKDYNEAVRWYRKSAEAGDAEGMLNLDLMYKAGRISSDAYNEAASLYKKNSANSSVRITSPTIK